MSLRGDLADLLCLDRVAFRDRAPDVLARHGVDASYGRDGVDDGDATGGEWPIELPGHLADEDLSDFERELVGRVRLLNDAPLGVTLSGPAYQDNPIIHTNEAFCDLTGYSTADVYGENPRLLQGPATEADAVADLREALSIWEPVTVELTNYRRDGTPFRNRVSLVPLEDPTGTVTNWAGIQGAVDE